MARHSVAALDWLVDAMDRNAEAFLRRTKVGSKLDRLAMRGPARVLIRYFLVLRFEEIATHNPLLVLKRERGTR